MFRVKRKATSPRAWVLAYRTMFNSLGTSEYGFGTAKTIDGSERKSQYPNLHDRNQSRLGEMCCSRLLHGGTISFSSSNYIDITHNPHLKRQGSQDRRNYELLGDQSEGGRQRRSQEQHLKTHLRPPLVVWVEPPSIHRSFIVRRKRERQMGCRMNGRLKKRCRRANSKCTSGCHGNGRTPTAPPAQRANSSSFAGPVGTTPVLLPSSL